MGSKERLQFIFRCLLPNLAGKRVLDIGSRIGAVLYGAYYYSQASNIVGVEINPDFCKLQTEMVNCYNLSSRVTIVEGDMRSHQQLVNSSDVVILNNVFSWFMEEELQVKMWQFLYCS